MSDPQFELKHWFHRKTSPHGVKSELATATGYTPTQISRMRNIETDDPKKRQEIPLDMIEKAAKFFSELPPGFEGMTSWVDDAHAGERTVPIVGYAGAGPDGSVLFAEGQGNYGEATAPIDAAENAEALEVRGDSMHGMANDGWLIFYEDKAMPSADHMGEPCVCWLTNGRVVIKEPQWGSAPGLFHLTSINAKTMADVAVDAMALVTDIKTRASAKKYIRRHPNVPITDLVVEKK